MRATYRSVPCNSPIPPLPPTQICQQFLTTEFVRLLGVLAESPRAQDRLYARCLLLHCYASSAPCRHQVRIMIETQLADAVQDPIRRRAVPFTILTLLELVSRCVAARGGAGRSRLSPQAPRFPFAL